MLKEAIEKIISLAPATTYQINGDTYAEKQLVRIAPHEDRPQSIMVNSLEGIVKLISDEYQEFDTTLFVEVVNHSNVEVYTSYRDNFKRDYLYCAKSDTPCFTFGWKDYDNAIIAFRSQFIENEGTEYILDILSRISDENSVSSEDNGMTQTVEARKGISLKTKERVNPRVKLCPYRTFLEVEQPESEFLLRLREGGQIGLFEADGGMWRLAAKKNIKAYLESQLKDLIEKGKVIVMA